METVLLGLAIAALWGSGDTLAAKVSHGLGSAATTLIAQVAGLLLAALIALQVGVPVNLTPYLLVDGILSGILLGAIAALAYLTLYQALHRGPLAVASPLVSAQGGVTLLTAIIVLHEMPGIWQMVFLLVTFVGVMMAAVNGPEVRRIVRTHTPHSLPSPGITLALVSMLGFGILAFGLGDAARESNWLLCVVWTRIFSCFLLTVCLRPTWNSEANAGKAQAENTTSASRRRGSPRLWLCGIGAVIVGCADVGGLLLLSLASTIGSIGVVGMVASAYGVIPLATGIFVFKERPTGNQMMGVFLLIVELVGVAAPSPSLNWPLLGGVGALLAASVGLLLCRKFLPSGPAIPAEWTRVAREVSVLAPPQQQELLGLLREAVNGLDTLALSRIPPCVAFFGSAYTPPDNPAYIAAYETARLLAEAGFGIMSGGACGIMEAANRGACEGGMLSVACLLDQSNRRESEEEWTNAYLDVALHFSNVASRQMTVSAAARAFVIFPGGFDTLDGLCQAVRAMQAEERIRVPIVLYDSSFWNSLFDGMADKLLEAGMIDPEVSDIIHFCDEPTEIAAYITACLFSDRIPQEEGQQEAELSNIGRH